MPHANTLRVSADMFSLSLGIMAHNEEANIGRLLQAVLKQQFSHGELKRLSLLLQDVPTGLRKLSGGSRGKTRESSLSVSPPEKEASAINLFLAHASGDIFILESADTLPDKDCLDRLIAPFENPGVGIDRSPPRCPSTQRTHLLDLQSHLMWTLHHKIALQTPKLGELVSISDFVRQIPNDTAVDEASIEAIVKQAGFNLCYVPGALVRIKGPDTIADFIKQRRRIAAGHLDLARSQSYRVSTSSPLKILGGLAQWTFLGVEKYVLDHGAIVSKLVGRGFGYYDLYVRKRILCLGYRPIDKKPGLI